MTVKQAYIKLVPVTSSIIGGIVLNWSRRSSSGFSIIEVLIVIAVLAILSGILFPVLNRSKDKARAVKCASNLRQLGSAFHLYVEDWNGVYPSPGGKKGSWGYWSQTAGGGLTSYVRSSGGIGTIWCCPEQTDWDGKYPARTYSMNSYLRDTSDVAKFDGGIEYDYDYPSCINIMKGIRETQIEDPRRTILLYEGVPVTLDWPEADDYIYRCGNWRCVRGWWPENQPRVHTRNSWKPWHGTMNNYLYCDGHLRTFRPNKWPNDPPIDMKNEWYVRKSAMTAKYGHK